jgi:hypothetical protein
MPRVQHAGGRPPGIRTALLVQQPHGQCCCVWAHSRRAHLQQAQDATRAQVGRRVCSLEPNLCPVRPIALRLHVLACGGMCEQPGLTATDEACASLSDHEQAGHSMHGQLCCSICAPTSERVVDGAQELEVHLVLLAERCARQRQQPNLQGATVHSAEQRGSSGSADKHSCMP